MDRYRELSEPCFGMLETVPGLRELFDGVCNDEDLRWEVRLDNWLTCYYKSGKLFGMKFHPRGKKLTFQFNPGYFHLDDAHRTMFAVPKCRKEFGQMDMVAVRREGERYIPVLIELKHGRKAFDGDSGILDHYYKIIRFLSTADGEGRLVETIRRIWKTKFRLELLKEPAPDAKAFGEAELMFAVTGWPGGSAGVIRGLLPGKLERTVRVAISDGEELYFDRKANLLV